MAMAASGDGIVRRTVNYSRQPPLGNDRRVVLLLVGLSIAIFLALAPIANVQLAPRPAFVPAILSSLFICCLLTALILFGRFSVQRTPAQLVLASAYLFVALTIASGPEVMPGMFLTTSLFATATKGVSWLVLRETAFPLFLLAYAFVKEDERPLGRPLLWGLTAVGAMLLVIAGFATVADRVLPELLTANNTKTRALTGIMLGIWVLDAAALGALWWRRPRASLDLWLLVVMVAWACQLGLGTVLMETRYDVGYYSGRIYELIAAAFLLIMLLRDSRNHFASLARTLATERDAAESPADAADRASRETAETLRAVIDASYQAVIALSSDGIVLLWNNAAARMFGFSPDEVIGKPYPRQATGTATEEQEKLVGRVMAGETLNNLSFRRRHRDGTERDLYGAAAPFYRASGRIGGAAYVLEDVTEKKATEEMLRQSQKMEAVGQLTGGVAHDFNNILMVILANVEDLLEAENLSDEQREQLNSISTSGQRAAELTKRLLAFSRKQRLMPQPTNMNDLVTGTDKLLRRTLGEHIEIEAILQDDLWTANIDRAQLEAALVNLCVNARDAMPDGGRLLIETANVELDETYAADNPGAVAGAYAMLAVSDTGAGMPADVLKKVFEPFFTTKGVGKGTGLGLSMVYGFIKQSNGHIKIYSEVGRGTTIRLYMPRTDALTQEVAPVTQALPRGTERILLVEDDDQVRTSVFGQLRSLGYSVKEVAGAQPALDLLESGEKFDLMLTDVIMPGIDGPSLAKIVGGKWPGLKVIFMSGYSENAARSHNRVAADARILSKPFRKIDLALRVRQAFEEE
jgi:PAS domain S-box-containing protein